MSSFNLLFSGISITLSKELIKNLEIEEARSIVNKKRYRLYFIALLSIVSIYFLTTFSGGFYWSPFTGYYSLLITTLSLCIWVWEEKPKQRLKATKIFGLALTVVIVISAFDNIELYTTEKVQIHENIAKVEEYINNSNGKEINWSLRIVDHYSVLTRYFPKKNDEKYLVLIGILSEAKEEDMVKEMEKTGSLANLIVAIQIVGERSRYFSDNRAAYKIIFWIVMMGSALFSLGVLNKEYIKDY